MIKCVENVDVASSRRNSFAGLFRRWARGHLLFRPFPAIIESAGRPHGTILHKGPALWRYCVNTNTHSGPTIQPVIVGQSQALNVEVKVTGCLVG